MPYPRDSNSVGLGWGLRIWISNKLPVDRPHLECLWWITPYLLINMSDGAGMVRSRQTSKACSIAASWCHTFEYLSPDNPPHSSLSILFSDGTSQPSCGNLACPATCCKLRPLRSEGEEGSVSGVSLAHKSWCPCVINSIISDKAKQNKTLKSQLMQLSMRAKTVPLRDKQGDYTMCSVDTEASHDIAASPHPQPLLISPHLVLLSLFPSLPSFYKLFKVQGHSRIHWHRQRLMTYCSVLCHCPSEDLWSELRNGHKP